jgi:hypothetical protein
MDLVSLLSTYWAPTAVAGAFVISLVLLKYKHEMLVLVVKEQAENDKRLEDELREVREEMRLEIFNSRTQIDANLHEYIEMEKAEHLVIIARFDAGVERLAQRVDMNNQRLAEKIDKLVDFNIAQLSK